MYNGNMRIVYYVSGHGMGHAIRTTEVIRALRASTPNLEVQIRTSASRTIFERNLVPCPEVVPLKSGELLDVGLVQRDCLHPDFEETYKKLKAILNDADDLIERERQALLGFDADLAATDIPFLAPAAAAKAGLPCAILANFTWDWIYEHYSNLNSGWNEAAKRIRDYYRMADLVVRFPLSPEMPQFSNVRKVGLTGRSARKNKAQVRKELNIPEQARVVLITFTDVALSVEARKKMLEENPDVIFLYSGDMDMWGDGFHFVRDGKCYYPDLIAASDVILTKPGYGITADATVNSVPMVYTDRGNFPEYQYLVEAINAWLPHRYIPSGELYEGAVAAYINDLEPAAGQGVYPSKIHGATEAAEALLSMVR